MYKGVGSFRIRRDKGCKPSQENRCGSCRNRWPERVRDRAGPGATGAITGSPKDFLKRALMPSRLILGNAYFSSTFVASPRSW